MDRGGNILFINPVAEALLGAGLAELGATAFSAGFPNEKAAVSYLSAAAKPSADLAKIELLAAASFVMGSSTNTFPATLTNGLDVPVTVGVRFTSDAPQRVRVPDLEPVVLPPGEPFTVNITPEADANGVALVEAQIVTRGGIPVGKPTTIEITATNFGSIGWLIIVASGAVVLGDLVFASGKGQLAPGDYFVSLGLASRQGSDVIPHDRRYDSIHLQVSPDTSFHGLVNLEAQLRVN